MAVSPGRGVPPPWTWRNGWVADSEQGFVRVFELDDRVFYHQGQGVELLGDFVLTTEGQFEG